MDVNLKRIPCEWQKSLVPVRGVNELSRLELASLLGSRAELIESRVELELGSKLVTLYELELVIRARARAQSWAVEFGLFKAKLDLTRLIYTPSTLIGELWPVC